MSAVLNCNISFIGGGNMAQALIGGLIARGLPPTRITVSDPVEQVRELLKEKDVHVTEDNLAAIADADIVVFLQSNHRFWHKYCVHCTVSLRINW